jgi:hypothetical protein
VQPLLLRPAPLDNIVTRYLINGTILEKGVTEYKMWVLNLSTTFV